MKLFLFCFICAYVANFYVSYGFDVVSFKSGFDNYGIIAGFGDYNQDKLVDVFVISPSGMHKQSARIALYYRDTAMRA